MLITASFVLGILLIYGLLYIGLCIESWLIKKYYRAKCFSNIESKDYIGTEYGLETGIFIHKYKNYYALVDKFIDKPEGGIVLQPGYTYYFIPMMCVEDKKRLGYKLNKHGMILGTVDVTV